MCQLILGHFFFERQNAVSGFYFNFGCKIVIDSGDSIEKSIRSISIIESMTHKMITGPGHSWIYLANIFNFFSQINWDFFSNTLEHIGKSM